MLAQLAGATLACLFLWALYGKVGMLGATEPGAGISDWQAMLTELALTVGLVSTILGTASRAQNVGALSAVAVGGYIILAGLWSSPISGASMNPARSFGPDIALAHFEHLWLYVVGPPRRRSARGRDRLGSPRPRRRANRRSRQARRRRVRGTRRPGRMTLSPADQRAGAIDPKSPCTESSEAPRQRCGPAAKNRVSRGPAMPPLPNAIPQTPFMLTGLPSPA